MFGTRSLHTFRTTGRIAAIITGLGAALWLAASVGPAAAAEKPANLGKYCKLQYGHDYVTNIDRRDDGFMCTKSTSGGLGLLHRKVSAADICQAQHKTRRFRRTGKRLICITGASGVGRKAKTVDLKKYCKAKYGPTAKLTRRRTDNRPMCTVPTNRGRGLRHHVINLAGLCGGRATRVSGTTVRCSGSTVAGGGKGPASPSGRAPPGHAKGPADGRGGGSKATGGGASRGLGRLRGCGSVDHVWMKKERDRWGPAAFGGVPWPCPGLSGGKVVDLNAYCKKMHRDAKMVVAFAGGQPVCVPRGERGNAEVYRRGGGGIFQLIGACSNVYPEVGTGRQFKDFHVTYRYKDRRLTCFRIRLTCAELKNPGVRAYFGPGPRCRKKQPKREKYVEGET